MNAWYDARPELARFLIFLSAVALPTGLLLALDQITAFSLYAAACTIFRISRL